MNANQWFPLQGFSIHWVIAIHAFSCFFMTGLIWLIQLVHYPAYRFINPATFTQYQNFHTTTITYLVGPMMALELITAFALLADTPFSKIYLGNMLLLILIWLATAFLSVPAHGKLSAELDPQTIENLISTNWYRTIFWTLRSGGWLFYFVIKLS